MGKDGIFRKDDHRYLPLWEAKFFQQFDHRFGTFEDVPEENRFTRRASTNRVPPEQKRDPNYEVVPRYWVDEEDAKKKLQDIGWERDWIFSLRDVARVGTDSRTAMATLNPAYPHGHTAPVMTFDTDDLEEHAVVFTSLFTSFSFDFALRQAISGAHLTLYILKQLPMPTPDQIKSTKVQVESGSEPKSVWDFIAERGGKLIWTSHSLDEFGENVPQIADLSEWDEQLRRKWRAEIDAVTAHLYNLDKEKLSYILDDFEILRKKETEEHGEYLSKRLCLEAYSKMSISES